MRLARCPVDKSACDWTVAYLAVQANTLVLAFYIQTGRLQACHASQLAQGCG